MKCLPAENCCRIADKSCKFEYTSCYSGFIQGLLEIKLAGQLSEAAQHVYLDLEQLCASPGIEPDSSTLKHISYRQDYKEIDEWLTSRTAHNPSSLVECAIVYNAPSVIHPLAVDHQSHSHMMPSLSRGCLRDSHPIEAHIVKDYETVD